MPAADSYPRVPCRDVEFFLRCAWRQLVVMFVCSGMSSMITPRDLNAAIEALAPPPTWWRREARAGITRLDAYLSQAARTSGE
jgi:hypothetical protein